MISTKLKLHLLSLKVAYKIEVLKVTDSEIVVKIGRWQEYEQQLLLLLKDLKKSAYINRIEIMPETGIVRMTYISAIKNDYPYIERWINNLDQYGFL